MRPLPALVLLVACGPPTLTTDGGLLYVEMPDVVDLGDGSRILTGTTVYPALRCAMDCPPDGSTIVTACYTPSFDGPASQEGDVVTFAGEGPVAWTFAPAACDVEGYTPVADGLTVGVVTGEGVTPLLDAPLERAVEEGVAAGTARADVPERWVPAAGEPWRLLQGRTVELWPRLHDAADEPVAWNLGDGDWADDEDLTFSVTDDSAFAILSDGGAAELALAHPAGGFVFGDLVAAAPEEVVAIELVPVYLDDEETGGEAPFGARAVLRDASGAPVFGGEVAWTVDGDLAVEPLDPTTDYAALSDCLSPAEGYGERTATLTATFGDLSASETLTWTQRTEPASAEGWVTPGACPPPAVPPTVEEGGCGCRNGVGGSSLLLVLVALRRRRQDPI